MRLPASCCRRRFARVTHVQLRGVNYLCARYRTASSQAISRLGMTQRPAPLGLLPMTKSHPSLAPRHLAFACRLPGLRIPRTPRAGLRVPAARQTAIKLLYGTAFRVHRTRTACILHRMTPGPSPRGKSGQRILLGGSLSKVRPEPPDCVRCQADRLIEQQSGALAALRERGIHTGRGIEAELRPAPERACRRVSSPRSRECRDEITTRRFQPPAHSAKLGVRSLCHSWSVVEGQPSGTGHSWR